MSLSLAACGPSFAATPAPSPAASPQALAPQSLEAQTQIPEATLTSAPAPQATATEAPFELNFTPQPTETPLPTLALPTEAAFLPSVQAWDGLPTYLADSKPDYYFRLRYDPTVWALTTDNFGSPALGHREIPDCMIAPASGRGLPLNVTAEHDTRHLGSIQFQIDTVYVDGIRQFVVYTGGNGTIFTAFQVSFEDQADACLADAEDVLSTLTSVPVSQATPIATP